MLTFDVGAARFNYRVAGVTVERDRVLLHRADAEDFWTLPGGRVEHGEVASTALHRELQEELGCEVEVGRLLYIVENFFEYDGRSCHELALYFLIQLPPELISTPTFEGREDSLHLIFQWHDLDSLQNLALFPSFLKNNLSALPEHPLHVVHWDR
jgi:ADP-ribose pyrophosphatase YjhB (NUDIX family)